jgi:hypothetical protein
MEIKLPLIVKRFSFQIQRARYPAAITPPSPVVHFVAWNIVPQMFYIKKYEKDYTRSARKEKGI